MILKSSKIYWISFIDDDSVFFLLTFLVFLPAFDPKSRTVHLIRTRLPLDPDLIGELLPYSKLQHQITFYYFSRTLLLIFSSK